MLMKTLCFLSFVFVVSWAAVAQDIEISPNLIFTNPDSVYSFTPTEDGQQGYHLWVWKPSFESNMPILGNDLPKDHPMIINPLKQGKPMPEIRLEELISPDSLPKMPNMLDKQGEERR